MSTPRALFASIVILSMLSTLAACGNRKPLKDTRNATAAQAAAGINGVYRSEAELREDEGNYVSAKFRYLEIKDNQLIAKALHEDTLEMQSDVIGQVRPAGGAAFEVTPAANLEDIVKTRTDLVNFFRMFDNGARVRILVNGDQISIVTIRGNDQSTPSLYRRLTPQALSQQQEKVQTSARRLRDFRVNFIRDWGNKKLELTRRSVTRRVGEADETQTTEGAEIPAETEAAGGKKNLQFKTIEFLSATQGRTNERHEANVRLLVRNQDSSLWIEYISAADPAQYVAASMLVKINSATDGNLVLEENSRSHKVVRTYVAASGEAAPPAAETPPPAEGAPNPAPAAAAEEPPVAPGPVIPVQESPPPAAASPDDAAPVPAEDDAAPAAPRALPRRPISPTPGREVPQDPPPAPAEQAPVETDPETGLPMVIPGYGPIQETGS